MIALISGGGIAGPITAMALQQQGIAATVFEAHPPIDPKLGSYFTITPNGLAALEQVEALHLVKESGFPTRHNVLWSHNGRRLGSVSLESGRSDSPPAFTVKRSRLVSLLQQEAERRGISIEYEKRLVHAHSGDGGVTARFADGEEATGDLLIGCDGIHSVVRKLIDPGAPEGRYVGLTNFGGFTPAAAEGIEPGAWHMIFGRNAFFGYAATPAGDVVWFVNAPRELIASEERRTTPPDEWRSWLGGLVADDLGPAASLIERGDLELFGDNTHDLGHVPTWHRGRMVIIGDAAHAPSPSSGQGASMAIEDGIILARALRVEAGVAEAFSRYEALRRERVEKIVQYGARMSNQKTPGPVGRFARDLILPLVFRLFVTEKSVRWMYDYRIGEELEKAVPAR